MAQTARRWACASKITAESHSLSAGSLARWLAWRGLACASAITACMAAETSIMGVPLPLARLRQGASCRRSSRPCIPSSSMQKVDPSGAKHHDARVLYPPLATRLDMSLVRDGWKAPGVQIAGSCQLSPSANGGRTCIAGSFLLPHVQLRTEVHNRQTLRRICSCPAKVLAGRNERLPVLKRRRWCYVTLSRAGNTTRAFAASLLGPENGLESILYGCRRLFAISSAPSRHCRPAE
jgi:hypothetical protein